MSRIKLSPITKQWKFCLISFKLTKQKKMQMKKNLLAIILLLTAGFTSAQQSNFSGNWDNPELEMISGKQYSNAMPKEIKVTQTKDSIKLEKVSVDGNGDITTTETIALNGKKASRIGKTSKRTISSSGTWSKDGQKLTLLIIYSYAEKPGEVEYTNTEAWELSSDGRLTITKTSDAAVTDDWTIKAVYNKN